MLFVSITIIDTLSAEAVEYAVCISADLQLNKCPGYDNKPSGGEALFLELLGI